MAFKILPILFLCCLAFVYVYCTPISDSDDTKSPEDEPNHHHTENCTHPIEKIKQGLKKVKDKISQTVTKAKDAVVEKFRNIKASIDKNKNRTVTTTENTQYGRRDDLPEPYFPTSPPFNPYEPQDPQTTFIENESQMPQQPDDGTQSQTGFSSGSNAQPSEFPYDTSSTPTDTVNESAVNTQPTLLEGSQDTVSESEPSTDYRLGNNPSSARMRDSRRRN